MTRRRFRWDLEAKALVEVGEDYAPGDKVQPVYTDRYMEGVAAVDGTDISSRKKRREYMHVNGLADVSDCKGMWEKAAKDREAFRRGETKDAGRREAIARAMYQHTTGRR